MTVFHIDSATFDLLILDADAVHHHHTVTLLVYTTTRFFGFRFVLPSCTRLISYAVDWLDFTHTPLNWISTVPFHTQFAFLFAFLAFLIWMVLFHEFICVHHVRCSCT